MFLRTTYRTNIDIRYFCTSSCLALSNRGGPPGKTQFDRNLDDLLKKVKKNGRQLATQYEGLLKKHLPSVYPYHLKAKNGTKALGKDASEWWNIRYALLKGRKMSTFNRRELVILRDVPYELRCTLPFLFVMCLPFAFILLPIVFVKFPHIFLSSHYISEEMRMKTELRKHLNRLRHCEHVLNNFQSRTRSEEDSRLKYNADIMLMRLDKGDTVQLEDIKSISPLFAKNSHQIYNLPWIELFYLSKSMGVSGFLKSDIHRNTVLALNIDYATLRENPSLLSDLELKLACFRRGINPLGLSRTEQIKYINKWLEMTKLIQNLDSLSLLLHGPAFLGYNHPSNDKLKEKAGLKWKISK